MPVKTASTASRHHHLAGLFLATLSLFLIVSLLTHDPADDIGSLLPPLDQLYTPDQLAYPVNETPRNGCGYWGALVSHLLLQSVGVGAYGLVPLVAVGSWRLLRGKSQQSGRAIRWLGWSLVLLSVTALPPHLKLPLSIPSTLGSGGYLGAMTTMWLHEHFAWWGGLILLTSLLVGGLLLSTEAWLLRVAESATERSVNAAQRMAPVARQWGGNAVAIAGQAIARAPAMAGSPLSGSKTIQSARNILPWNRSARSIVASDDLNPPVGPGAIAKPAPKVAPVAVEAAEEVARSATTSPSKESAVPEPTVAHPPPKFKTRGKSKAETTESLEQLDDARLPEGTEEYVLPDIELLMEPEQIAYEEQEQEVRRKAAMIEQTFADFGLKVRVAEIETGPVIAQYEIELEAGLRLSKITGLSDDLAIALRVPSVRIVAPIPGKNTVGIEVPNERRQVVRLREVIEEGAEATKKMKIPLFLGKDVSGNPLSVDLASLPHLLIAGRTGTGKSVCLNSIITSILMTRRPDEVRMLMIDPKMVELSGYGRLPHLMHPVVTDMKKAEAILAWAVDKMEERYALLARAGVRHITNYNQLGRTELLERMNLETPDEAELIPEHLPFIVIVADEMADLMMTAGKEVEAHIIRLAQKSRAVGIHLILATQKPTVDVITGLIKSNLPARISFQVASRTDSRVVLDEMGADKLLGNGDMLFLWPGTSMLLRGQGTYLSDEEINRVVAHCSTGEQNFVQELVHLKVKQGDEDESPTTRLENLKKRDDLYEAAIDIVIREGRGSCSLLQRALGIGYGRAARLIDFMAEDGIVGQYNGSQAREVVISISDWEAMKAGQAPSEEEPSGKRNRIRMDGAAIAPAPKSPAAVTSLIPQAATLASLTATQRSKPSPEETDEIDQQVGMPEDQLDNPVDDEEEELFDEADQQEAFEEDPEGEDDHDEDDED
jgi:S-DNA-T family DNA segregation ATPase FtsK/SpoIIIE